MSDKQAAMEQDAVRRTGEISRTIREAIRAALPAPPEQFLTIMIPGKVITYDDYKVLEDPLEMTPLMVELNQARLCDDMPALASVQLGPTGKSVARSYATAISKLIPAGTTIGIESGSGALSDDQKRYKQAMAILSSDVPNKDGLTLVELYTKKQKAYTDAVTAKTRSFDEAMQIAKADPANKTPDEKRAAYDRWVQENAKAYRNSVQAAYMDWVIMGKKEEVEYWFSVVDQDSALARVEASKETMRLAVVQSEDGSSEYQKVHLEPRDWANKCEKKALSGNNQTKTIEWYTWEIARLEKQNNMLDVLKKNPPTIPSVDNDGEAAKKKFEAAKTALDNAIVAALAAESALQGTPVASGKEPEDTAEKEAWEKKKNARQEAANAHKKAQETLRKAREDYDAANVENLSRISRETQNALFKNITEDGGFVAKAKTSNDGLIKDYREQIEKLKGGDGKAKDSEDPKARAVVDELTAKMGVEKAAPMPGAKDDSDYFTPISVSISASSDTQKSSESASSLSFGASASYGAGPWAVSASVSHSENESHAEALKELANCDVNISFECMRVDISRPWLRPELFYDEDLVIGPGGPHLSPGFSDLGKLLEGKFYGEGDEAAKQNENKLREYSIFPMYPTAFLVACNVVLEISGSTSKLQTAFNSSSSASSAALSVGYGPFSASGTASHAKSKSSAESSCETTASGCRITIKSPQIIGWISQMVPALPRKKD